MHVRRPLSLSEGNIPLSDYNFLDDRSPISLNNECSEKLEIKENTENTENTEVVVISFDCLETVVEYLLRFLMHLSLISFFETLFFFQFVSVDEDRGIDSIATFYTNKVLSVCANFTTEEKAIADYFLQKYNTSSLINDGLDAAAGRIEKNHNLNIKSWVYFGGLSSFLLLLVGFSRYKKYKIRWVYIIVENCIFVTMLGLYEFMFFESIIKNYLTLTPAELTGQFITGLESTCGLVA